MIGLLQAVGVATYVLLFSVVVTNIDNLEHSLPEALAPAFFLMIFIISALVCGSTVLAYPATLALKGKVKEALEVVAWSAGWLAVILVLIVMLARLAQFNL